jgi:hypothetical protein
MKQMDPVCEVWLVWHRPTETGRYYSGVFQTYDEALIAYTCAIKHYPKTYLQKYVFTNDERSLSNG